MQSTTTARRALAPLAGVSALVLIAAAITFLPLTTALVLIGGGFLCLALLRYPELAVYLLVFAIPFGSLFPLPVGGANVTAADGLLLLAAALWLARGIARRQIVPRRAELLVPFLVFILAAGVSVTGALSLQASAKELLKWIEMLAVYWLIVQDFGRAQIERVLAVIFIAGLAEAAVGLYQSLLDVGPAGFLLFGGTSLRAFGTFEQPNPFAGYLGLIIPLAFGVALGIIVSGKLFNSLPDARLKRYALLALTVVTFGAALDALFFSLSRGAWLGVATALGVTLVIRSRRSALLGLALAGLVGVVVLLGQLNVIPDVVSARFAGVSDYFGVFDVRGYPVNDTNYAIVERMAHWQAAWYMFEDHPWLGVGFGNYAAVYPAYALPHWEDPLGHAHNYYLNVAAESGLIGLAAYAFLWIAIFWSAWRAVRTTHGFAQGVAAGAFGVLVALSIHNLFDNLFVHSMQMQVGITLGVIEVTKRIT
jgi:O-antigen ligase